MTRVRWRHTQPTAAPAFVIVGMDLPNGAGVALYASTELSAAELRAEMEFDTVHSADGYDDLCATGYQKVTLSVTMRAFHVAYGHSYTDALVNLLEGEWRPPDYQPPGDVIEGQLVGPPDALLQIGPGSTGGGHHG